MIRLFAIASLCLLGAPAFAQSSEPLPRFEALEQTMQTLEQGRLDTLERQRQSELIPVPGHDAGPAERGLRALDYERERNRLLLQGEQERALVQRERDVATSTLPSRRIAAYSSLVVRDPERYILPPAPPGHYYARLEGRFVLVDGRSETVVKVLGIQPTDPTADVPAGPRPPTLQPAPIGPKAH